MRGRLRKRLSVLAARMVPRVPVRLATTDVELEAIARFRYTVYFEEKGWRIGGVDPDTRRIEDAIDRSRYARHFYIGELDDIRAACRLLVFPPGDIPASFQEEFATQRIPGIDALTTSEIGRFCVRRGFRGKQALPSLAVHLYDHLVGTEGGDLCFSICRPTMMKYYMRLGSRPYGAPVVPTEVGLAIPLVSVLSDRAYFEAVGAITSHRLRHHFGRGGRRPLDLAPFEPLFREDPGVQADPDRLHDFLKRWTAGDDPVPAWISALPAPGLLQLSKSCFLLDVRAGNVIVQQGMDERELYAVVSGRAIVERDGVEVNRIEPGDVIGELALLRETGRRTATVRMTTPGRILVIRYRFLQELLESSPRSAYWVAHHLGRVLADRLDARTADRALSA
jgi:CRP-like cAMP-binding protein